MECAACGLGFKPDEKIIEAHQSVVEQDGTTTMLDRFDEGFPARFHSSCWEETFA